MSQTLAEKIHDGVLAAMRSGETVQRDVLRVALGEIQTVTLRKNKITEAEAEAILRKMIAGLEETAAACVAQGKPVPPTTEQEKTIINSLLPQLLTKDEIKAALTEAVAQIKSAGNDGQATGVAMKALAGLPKKASGKDVAEVVKEIRSV